MLVAVEKDLEIVREKLTNNKVNSINVIKILLINYCTWYNQTIYFCLLNI